MHHLSILVYHIALFSFFFSAFLQTAFRCPCTCTLHKDNKVESNLISTEMTKIKEKRLNTFKSGIQNLYVHPTVNKCSDQSVG